jgi:predicted AAA+ superfamily ATPase
LGYKNHEYLYLDLLDERINLDFIKSHLDSFCKSHSLKLLIIENYDATIMLPNIEEVILSTCDFSLHVKDFEELILYPLDFEEFIAFDRKHSSIEQLFNNYANHGTFPQIVLSHENNLYKNMQDLLKLIIDDKQKFALYKKFCELQSTKISLFQIYNQLKSSMKLSKDKLYKSVAELENERLLFLVGKFHFPKANKKVFLIDFAFKNALSFKKDFIKRFENIIFLELLKKEHEIFYTDFIDLYLPQKNLAIICLPFSPQNVVASKLKKSLLHFQELYVQTIEIISLGNEAEFMLEDITCRIIPFWDWALKE